MGENKQETKNSSVESYSWKNSEGKQLASLEVDTEKMSLLFKVIPSAKVDFIKEMQELDQEGLYKNKNLSVENESGELTFLIEQRYNFNSRWRDFLKYVDRWAGVDRREISR